MSSWDASMHDPERRADAIDGGEALARFVRECRAALGLSQAEAARKSAVSKTTWQKVESGQAVTARNATLHAVAKALGVEAHLLMQLRDEATTLDDVRRSARSREDILGTIAQYATWLRTEDLLAVEDAARVRAHLRRLQRTSPGDE